MSKKVATDFLRAFRKIEKMHQNDEFATHFDLFRNSLLKWSSIPSIRDGKKKVYVIPPQDYNSVELMDKNHQDIPYFYDYNGNAVTGSGGDVWIVADEKSLDHALKILNKRNKRKSIKRNKKSTRNTRKSVRKNNLNKSTKCTKQKTKKYTSRPSPPFPANACKGLYKKGNDGRRYLSSVDVNGIYRWRLEKEL